MSGRTPDDERSAPDRPDDALDRGGAERPPRPAPVIGEDGLIDGDLPEPPPRRAAGGRAAARAAREARAGRPPDSLPETLPPETLPPEALPPETLPPDTPRRRLGGTAGVTDHRPGGGTGGVLRRLIFVLAALGVSVWIAVAAMAAATDREAAIPALGELIGALADPAALVALHDEEIAAQIEAGAAALRVPGFPGDITVPAEAATGPDGAPDPARAAAALRDAAAEVVYRRGPDALFGEQAQPPTMLSDAGSVRTLMRSLGEGRHDTALTLSWGAGLIAIAFLGALALSSRNFTRFAAPGGAVVLGGVLVVLAGFVVPTAAEVLGIGPGGALGDTYHGVLGDLSGAARRDGVIAVAAGSALLIPSTVAGIIFGASRLAPRPASPTAPHTAPRSQAEPPDGNPADWEAVDWESAAGDPADREPGDGEPVDWEEGRG